MPNRKPGVLFLSHGGGPLPLLGDEAHRTMVENLEAIASRLEKPSAILLISAHWEESVATLTSGAKPSLIYDYYGFPEESYSIQYPCPGEPALAEQVHQLLGKAGIESRLDNQRGFDHGLFVPLKIMYPDADIPAIQLSLIQSMSAEEHLDLGKALSTLEYENLLVIGSGFSFHNMQAFFASDSGDAKTMNESFEEWLIDTCTSTSIEEDERRQRYENWEQAPYARFCHPREEHLMPLHVCYGIAQSASKEHYELSILNKKSSSYLW